MCLDDNCFAPLNSLPIDTSCMVGASPQDIGAWDSMTLADTQLFKCRHRGASEAPEAVDYLGTTLDPDQYSNCWKRVCYSQAMCLRREGEFEILTNFPCTPRFRLNNACWRAWYKSTNKLPELNPQLVNWYKVNDVTCLYGPDMKSEEKSVSEAATPVVESSDDESDLPEIGTCSSRNSTFSISSSTSTLSSGSSDSSYPLKSILKKERPAKSHAKSKRRISFYPRVEVGIFFS